MRPQITIRHLAFFALVIVVESAAHSQTSLSLPPDSPRWELQGEAKVADYQGRRCLLLNGGAASVNDFEMRDGIVDVDVATPATRGFFGIQFRIDREGRNELTLAVSELGGGWGFICRLADPEN